MCTSLSLLVCQRYSFCRGGATMTIGKITKRQHFRTDEKQCFHDFFLVRKASQRIAIAPIVDVERRDYGSAAIASSALPGALSKQQAKELAVRLTSDERDVLISALQECQSHKIRAEYEGQLAAFRWRSKFGRPSRVPTLGDVDPTGSYCAVPDDWLLRKYVETVPQPMKSDLIRVAVANAIPFIGFGFLDNFIMIIAGEHIETSMGAIISLSTMAAAALGNTISDILGIGSAFYVELLAQKIGFRPPKLTPIQLDMPRSRRAANMGRVIGVTIGCILGMTPLLLMGKDAKKEEITKVSQAQEPASVVAA